MMMLYLWQADQEKTNKIRKEMQQRWKGAGHKTKIIELFRNSVMLSDLLGKWQISGRKIINYRAVICYGEERVGNNPNSTDSLTVPKEKKGVLLYYPQLKAIPWTRTLTISRRKKKLGREKERKEEAEQDILQQFRNFTRNFQMIICTVSCHCPL